jgi:hypothetical protein
MTPAIESKLIDLRRYIPKSRIERLIDETTDVYLQSPTYLRNLCCCYALSLNES